MSRGLRAGVMAAPAPRRTLTKEADEELALFFEMRKLEKERSNKPLHNASEIDLPLGPKPGIAPLFKIMKARMDEFLNSDRGKNDYDWNPSKDAYPKASHVGLGLVLGSDGKRFRTRSSEVVRLVELLDEAKNRSKAELIKRLEDNGKITDWTDAELESTAEAVGYDAIKLVFGRCTCSISAADTW